MNVNFKQKLLLHVIALLQERKEEYSRAIEDVRVAQQTETKSSAGDKYETTREMMTQQIETLSVQLTAVERDLLVMQIILSNPVNSSHIRHGSVVTTSAGVFLIAIGLGKVTLDDTTIQVISANSPLAKLLMGKSKGETGMLIGREISVEQVL